MSAGGFVVVAAVTVRGERERQVAKSAKGSLMT